MLKEKQTVTDDVEISIKSGSLVFCVSCNRPVYWLKYEGIDNATFPDDFISAEDPKEDISPDCPGCKNKAFYNDANGVATFRTARGFKNGTA